MGFGRKHLVLIISHHILTDICHIDTPGERERKRERERERERQRDREREREEQCTMRGHMMVMSLVGF